MKTDDWYDEGAQIIITIGVVMAITLVVITTMFNDIIYVENAASIGGMDTSRHDLVELQKLISDESEYARINDSANYSRYASNYTAYMTNFGKAIAVIYAARGRAVDATATAMDDSGIINSSDKVALCGTYCSDESPVRDWMDKINRNYTDYESNCSALIDGLCTSGNCLTASSRNFTVAILENPNLANESLTSTQRGNLTNFTNLPYSKYIQMGNGTVIDALNFSATGKISAQLRTGSASTGVSAFANITPLLKNVVVGTHTVGSFSTTGYLLDLSSTNTKTVYESCGGGANSGCLVNWTNIASGGVMYYAPSVMGDVVDSNYVHVFEDDMRCMFNLFGNLSVRIKYSDGATYYSSTICVI